MWKLVQLAALPLALLVVAATVTPRHPVRAGRGSPWARAQLEDRSPAAFFAAGAEPRGAIELPSAPPLERPSAAAAGGWFQVAVVADLPDAATASRVADDLVALLGESAGHLAGSPEARALLLDERSPAPLTPAEAAAFARAGVKSGVGIGWPGGRKDAREAVLVLGHVLLVPGLKADFAGLRPNPLAALLSAWGARPLVEGDPSGGQPPGVDLTCTVPTDETATRLAEALRLYLSAAAELSLRPPWHPAGVSAAEARARATWARLTRAVREAALESEQELARRFVGDEALELTEEGFAAIMAAAHARALVAVDALAGDAAQDPVVLAEARRIVAETGHLQVADPAARRRLAERQGCLTLVVAPPGATGAAARVAPTAGELAYTARGRVQAQARRLELGGLTFHRIGRGLPTLLAWLRAGGCSDARLAIVPAPDGAHLAVRPPRAR